MAAPQGRDRGAAPPAGAQGRGRPGRARRGRGARARRDDGRGHRRPRAALPAPGGLPRAGASSTCSAWVDGGCGKPDFQRSLDLFRPERTASDGIEHLVVFPMYTPNGSPDTRFEALIVAHALAGVHRRARARAVRQRQVRAGAAGRQHRGLRQRVRGALPRDGERRRAADQPLRRRSSATARPRASAASTLRGAEVLRHRPAAGRACAASLGRPRARDLHPLGPDPRPLAQPRRPALRPVHDPPAAALLDVLARGAARGPRRLRHRGELARDGFPFARYVQYAILFDRLLRFPITGNRVRNYDGLGGQLLFAFLHDRGVVHWTDNRLLIDWERVEGASASCASWSRSCTGTASTPAR